MKYIYVAIHAQHLVPITAADRLDDILLRVDDYMGATEEYKFSTTRIKWDANDSDYPDEYIGTLYYLEHHETVLVRIYEIEYIPKNV
jgi:hypothetical protein